MAYNVAANMQFAKPVSSFIDARDNVMRNALAERQVANQEGAQQFQQQRLSAADQITAQQREAEAEAEAAKKVYTAMQYLSRVADKPEQFQPLAQRMLSHPEIGGYLQRNGVTIEDITPDSVRELLAESGVQAGAAPAARFEEVKGPRGSLYKRNVDTGETAQVIGPDNTESPNYAPRAPAGYRFSSDGGLEAIPGGPADPNTPSTKDDSRTFAKADKLRDEFNAQSKEFITVGDSYNMVREVAKNPDAAGDLSMIFAFMKMLDPNSVVREQEFANAQNAAGVPDRIRNQYNKVVSGERLNPTQRAEFIGQAKNLFNARKARQDVITKRYTEMAKRNGVNPDDVVGDLSVLMPDETAPSAAPKTPDPKTMKLPPQLSNGWTLHEDAKGNKAYVSPDGKQFKEVQ